MSESQRQTIPDLCVNVEDVPDSDLLSAMVKLTTKAKTAGGDL